MNQEFFIFMEINNLYVAIGTKNHAKIQAVIDAFDFLYKDLDIKIEYKTSKTDSGVGVQPIGLDLIIKGAKTRAKKAYEQEFYEKIYPINQCFGVGIESGLVPITDSISGYMDFQFIAVVHNGITTLGCGSAFEYPKFVIKTLFQGNAKEIGEVFEKLSGNPLIKQKEGAIGFLSQGKISRTDILKNGVIMALIPFIRSHLYFS